ncbi:hypothetical protein P280DRAFT_74443 [Massarina eburnea CBS 473.64]|uniref:Uncharacterized protein n=1 Tax=Massarina eburnea CBS 473.64 TaxID=1395130 RepID=A0A6A6RTR7_9PLEO|nr:hypothetical protein P280DRAFT_74443 [Massarina eburnea CBS 473.64]
MHLQSDAGLAEAPGFATDQLESLSRSIEAKKQKLEADIDAYIKKKQRELAQYEQELLAQYREMECGQTQEPDISSSPSSTSSVQNPEPSPDPHRPEEKEKRTKHTRVHKREKELFGLTTIFLPLLEASEGTPTKEPKKENKKRQSEGIDERVMPLLPNTESGSPSRADQQGVECRSRCKKSEKVEHADISYGDTAKDKRRADSVKKAKRPAMKKSSLRNSGEKSRRKRVSLVIDDQIVLPADHITEPPLTSPSDVAVSSASSSTSFDDAIDPRLMEEEHEESSRHEREDPMHHSIPVPAPLAGLKEHTSHTLSDSPISESPVTLSQPPSGIIAFEPPTTPPTTIGPTVIDPSPPKSSAARHIPQHASSTPIYASAPSRSLHTEEEFSSYVGGLSGSGVDDLDQTGSLGFPSSLGASYMESYMLSRPLSVRMAAADKDDSDDEEKAPVTRNTERIEAMDSDQDEKMSDAPDMDDGMDVIGSMEGF